MYHIEFFMEMGFLKLKLTCTYDSNFILMFNKLKSDLNKIEEIELLENKIEEEGLGSSFGSKGWYKNLTMKMSFLYQKMKELNDGEVICCSDADIQFFKPEELLKIKEELLSSDLEYIGQKERNTMDFNGGFFFMKKTNKNMDMLKAINSDDLTKYRYAEQELLNKFLHSLNIKRKHLDEKKYLHGCIIGIVDSTHKESIVMHHATCATNPDQKMKQMDEVRKRLGMNPIFWEEYKNINEQKPAAKQKPQKPVIKIKNISRSSRL